MTTERLLYWIPRILALIFTLFLGIFALDVFIPGKSVGSVIQDLIIHLIPNFLLFAVLLISWKREIMGGILFMLLGTYFTIFFETYRYLPNFLVVSLPVYIIGILFVMHNEYKEGHHI